MAYNSQHLMFTYAFTGWLWLSWAQGGLPVLVDCRLCSDYSMDFLLGVYSYLGNVLIEMVEAEESWMEQMMPLKTSENTVPCVYILLA